MRFLTSPYSFTQSPFPGTTSTHHKFPDVIGGPEPARPRSDAKNQATLGSLELRPRDNNNNNRQIIRSLRGRRRMALTRRDNQTRVFTAPKKTPRAGRHMWPELFVGAETAAESRAERSGGISDLGNSPALRPPDTQIRHEMIIAHQ